MNGNVINVLGDAAKRPGVSSDAQRDVYVAATFVIGAVLAAALTL